jgi:aerobic-type carbon monoxide dehydrogenase small subunit (CoxS/CutS family)
VEVSFRIDGQDVTIRTWADMSALLAIRLIARHDRPRRGCEAGQCGACESLIDGEPMRLCQLPSTSLAGLDITTRDW